ncbi:O-methyltransferase [Paenibacillus sambharensis]|uniref:O-methyltransferase n=1 Tax=Paenibacillus sambharensis TaxID=1803190 RepID=A0A2W1LWP4_9BACL|nr:O-methyltransferase [Paenibacillus sambharensis]PZD95927.1 O-methyltransferase [Paenibacillus sambharensis]
MHNAEHYAESLYPPDADLQRAEEGIRAAGMPAISVAPAYGKLLTLLVRASGASSILEIGALGGYSGICLARGLGEGGMLTSLEVRHEYVDVAYAHMTAAGLGGKVNYLIGDARDSLAELAGDGKRYDFFFIDADKEGYPDYLEWCMKLALPGAIIAADNVFLKGRISNPEKQGPSVRAMRMFNERIAADERLDSTILPAYDGLALAVVKG